MHIFHPRMKFELLVGASIAIAGFFGLRAWAQTPAGPPFMFATGTVAEPQIGVAVNGVSANISRATVSADRKYVTMELNPRTDRLLAFRTFTFQSGMSGFVGSATAQGLANPTNITSKIPTPSISNSARQIEAVHASVLDKPGMTMISPLQ